MNLSVSPSLAGWSAILSGIVTIIGLILIGVFFSVGEPYGSLNDIAIAAHILLMLPYAWALHQHFRATQSPFALIMLVVLVIGALAQAVSNVLLVARVISFEQSIHFPFNTFALIGLWLAAAGVMALRANTLPPVLSWIGIASGAGFVLMGGGMWFTPGSDVTSNMFVTVGGALGFPLYIVWSFWLGYTFLQRVAPGSGV
jgi:hypothetical protein